MSLNALVIGNDLAALVTALRLHENGFTVRVMEASVSMERPSALPVILHGPQEHTNSLLQQMGMAPSLDTLKPLPLEFFTDMEGTSTFRNPCLPTPWHMLIGLFCFSGISVSSRWKLFNYLEKLWEGEIHLSPKLHIQTAQDWLISCGQDEESQRRIWNPLCLFLLWDHLEQTAALPFIQALKQHFLDGRTHSPFRISSLEYVEFALSPIRKRLEQLGVSFHQNNGIRQIRISGDQLEGVLTEDGQFLKGDVFIATLSPFQITELMPERILARLGFFHQLNQLTTVPAVILNFSFKQFLSTPRLVLTNSMFPWITGYPFPQMDGGTQSCVSCMATATEQLHSLPDEQLRTMALQKIQRIFPELGTAISQNTQFCDLVRLTQACITYSPGTITFRPSHQTPLTNFFLAGHWTNTKPVNGIEGDIQSANLCVEMIKAKTSAGYLGH